MSNSYCVCVYTYMCVCVCVYLCLYAYIVCVYTHVLMTMGYCVLFTVMKCVCVFCVAIIWLLGNRGRLSDLAKWLVEQAHSPFMAVLTFRLRPHLVVVATQQ